MGNEIDLAFFQQKNLNSIVYKFALNFYFILCDKK